MAVSYASKLPLEVSAHQYVPPTFPLNPRSVLLHYSKFLIDHERTEILEYDQIYYIDTRYPKLLGASPKGVDNRGFDNQNAEYICEIGDHIAFRYEVIKGLGKGSFGQVYKCFDHKEKNYVAMKILLNKKRLFK